MSIIVIFLISLSRFIFVVVSVGTCVPNTEFKLNDKTCYCNNIGQWSESSCRIIDQQQQCDPGKIISEGCKQCVCQEDGQLLCNEDECAVSQDANSDRNYRPENEWCTPFKSYYLNCNICVCPASGKMSEARCARDPSCTLFSQPDFSKQRSHIICIPRVMYLFPCLRCLCTNEGFLVGNRCVETCNENQSTDVQKCAPSTYYRRDCNICKCPENGIADASICTNAICNDTTDLRHLRLLMSKNISCFPHTFIRPRCLYCDCTISSTTDETSCLELECVPEFRYDLLKTCNYGESVLMCTECLCLQNGKTFQKYCSKACSYESKLEVLDIIVKDMDKNDALIDSNYIKKTIKSQVCNPGSIYTENEQICICPSKSYNKMNICTTFKLKDNANNSSKRPITIDYNIKCEPHTFIEFECNTCFCNGSGRIDPKWCTFDDCELKKIVLNAHKSRPAIQRQEVAHCNPGSITKKECNFCICPDNGFTSELVCTKNDCTPDINIDKFNNDRFTCEPLVYYEVDCNVCFCPKDGLKNVAKCTKNPCEKSYLRSDDCAPGQLFSDECNVCVCPPNGNKAERACTNYTCMDMAPWKKIFQLSESLLGNQVSEDATRNLELCFPGEEFTVGCKLCVCPDMGLRMYASCSPILCEEIDDNDDHPTQSQTSNSNRIIFPMKIIHTRKNNGNDVTIGSTTENCKTINVTSNERSSCKPGSMYFVECKQCICPHVGDMQSFCRPFLTNRFCEQLNPQVKNLPRKFSNSTSIDRSQYTKYRCYLPGRIMDACFICDCENDLILLREQCFKKENESCEKATPTFLDDSDKLHDV